MRPSDVWPILKETGSDWSSDNASRLAAALAYYTLLSVAPLLILTISIAGLVFGQEAARGQIAGELGAVVGAQAGEAIQVIAGSAREPSSGVLGSVVGVVVLLFGASGVFGELQSALNAIWEVAAKPGRGFWGIVKDRFFSFTMVLGVGFLLLVSLVLSAGLAAAGHFLSASLPGGETLWFVVNFVVSIGLVTVLFALIFKIVPDAEIGWKDVWVGAFATALLFTLGKAALGLYLGKPAVTSSYGAAGSVVALVVWVYYSSQILFLGAEFTQVYAGHFGSRIRPSKNAVAAPNAADPAAPSAASDREMPQATPAPTAR